MSAEPCITADQSEVDTAMMERCIAFSASAIERGELPFSALVAEGARVVAETTNCVVQSADVTRHAELTAISEAQRVLGRKDLTGCTIYSNVEPCVMCSFPMRETRISRVIFAINSPMMGGFSKWNVLRDTEICDVMPEAFGPVPEVIVGLLREEAEQVWKKWNPVAWAVIKYRGCFDAGETAHDCERMAAIPQPRSLMRTLTLLHQNRHSFRRGRSTNGRNGHS
ncbi:MAG: nucleoside deaminase [Pseudolabrys sp.]|jgi:tRNA(adenine34) deaminase